MDLIAHRYRVAKKDYRCDLYRGNINKDDKYCYSFIEDGDDSWSHRAHIECEFVANELWNYINPWDGMSDEEFIDGCRDFCRHMLCPNCACWDDEYEECRNVQDFCFDKIVEELKKYDFTTVKTDDPRAKGKRCWGFVKKDEPVTKLPRYE